MFRLKKLQDVGPLAKTVIPLLTEEPDFRHVVFVGGHSVGKHPFIKERKIISRICGFH